MVAVASQLFDFELCYWPNHVTTYYGFALAFPHRGSHTSPGLLSEDFSRARHDSGPQKVAMFPSIWHGTTQQSYI